MTKNHIFRAFSEKSFVMLWLGEVFTQISINLFNFFLLLVVYSLTKSNTAVAGVVLSYTIPAILFGVVAGVYVDRWPKKKVMYGANILRALLLLLLIFFHSNLLAIYIISFFISVLTQFFIPAESPMIPLVVNKKQLFSANALFGMGLYGSILIAYILSGPLLLHFGKITVLLLLAGLMFVGAIFIYLIKIPKSKNRFTRPILYVGERGVVKEVRDALRIMTKTKVVRNSLFLLSLSQVLILVVSVLAPGYASQILKIRIEDFPLLFVAPAALGVVVAAVVIVNKFHDASKEKMATIGLLLSGLAMLFLPYCSKLASREIVMSINSYLPNFFQISVGDLLVVTAFILGVANALVFVPSNTLLQEKTTDEFRGKIYGALNTIVGIFSLLPVLLAGGLSDLLGVATVVTGIGIVILILGVFRLFFD
jgi:MFS family permease